MGVIDAMSSFGVKSILKKDIIGLYVIVTIFVSI